MFAPVLRAVGVVNAAGHHQVDTMVVLNEVSQVSIVAPLG